MSTVTKVYIKIKEDYNRKDVIEEFKDGMFFDKEDLSKNNLGNADWIESNDDEVLYEERGSFHSEPWVDLSKKHPSITLNISAENYDFNEFITYQIKNGKVKEELWEKYQFLRDVTGYNKLDLIEELFLDFETEEDYKLYMLNCELEEEKILLKNLVRDFVNVPEWRIKRRRNTGFKNRKAKKKDKRSRDKRRAVKIVLQKLS